MSKKDGNEILQEVLATFAAIIVEYQPEVDPFQIDWETNSRDFFNDDQEQFGIIMVDLHLFYEFKIEYEAYTEFEKFPTLEHAYNYVVDKVLVKEGINPTTLKPF